MPVADAVSFNIIFKFNNNSGNKEQAFHFVEDDWERESNWKTISLNIILTYGFAVESQQHPSTRRVAGSPWFKINSYYVTRWVSVSANVTGQMQRGGRPDGLFLQLPDMNSDPWDHIGPHPIRNSDPQPVAACGSVVSDVQHSWALVQTEVPEKSRGAVK